MAKKKLIAVLTGAGISAESGIKTFRDSGGLWENYDVATVASIDGWYANKALVLKFYNERRRQLKSVYPNAAHKALVELEQKHEVCIITQNVDDLHERGGSSRVFHLHGELTKMRSSVDETLVFECTEDIRVGDKCPKGSQLRPHIVWFGEQVPALGKAAALVNVADIVIIVGTSMQVYPAASLIHYKKPGVPVYFVDPKPAIDEGDFRNLTIVAEKATTGVRKVVDMLMSDG